MPTPMVHLRLDAETQAILDTLASELSLTRSAVVRLALHQLHKAPRLTPLPLSAHDIAQQRRLPGGRPGRRHSQAARSELES